MASSKRVLVIDDVSVIRGFVKAALRDLDVVVIEASEGAQALELHDNLPADVIICDINMPGLNGEGVLRALREKGDVTPVLMLTAEGDKAVVGNLLKLGIQGYLLKPFKPGVLSDRVQELLSGTAPPAPPAPAPDADDAMTRTEEIGSGAQSAPAGAPENDAEGDGEAERGGTGEADSEPSEPAPADDKPPAAAG